jgi:hypothetical protein
MKGLYARWITDWESRLCFSATNRVVRSFEWGLDWTANWPCSAVLHPNGQGPEKYLSGLNELAIGRSDEFYGYRTPTDYQLDGDLLRFTSPVHTPHAKNNTVHAQWFPAKDPKKRAVIVLPHWNARLEQHGGLAKGIRMMGISALRLSLPYHDYRMPPELERADYAVSSNIGRTMDATRQAVIDVRACLDWLEQQGYERLGIVGTSLGSCYAFLASAHDQRLRVNVFNHCSAFFADVVWSGLSTQHIRQALEAEIDVERLREVWSAISPVNYLEQFARWPKKSKFIYATYDTTFLPEFSRDIVQRIRQRGIDNHVAVLPCGHYTLGKTPYKFIDGYHICSHFRRWL